MARSKTFACSLLLTVSPLPVLAQGGSVFTLPLLIISATALPTPSEQIGSSVTVITAEEIERLQRRTVSDVLATVPGLYVVQSGSPGAQTSVFIRGLNSNQTKVFIDGIEVSDPASPNRAFDFGALTTADIERIEVLRGPQSGLYGSDAMGGVISVFTKKGSGPAKLATMAEGGSFGTFNKSAHVSGGTQNSHYAFTASNYVAASVPVTPLELLGPGQRRINDYTKNWTYSGKYGVDLSEYFGLNFVGRYTDQQFRFTNSNFNVIPSVPFDDHSNATSRQFSGLADAVFRLFDGRLNSHVGVTHIDIARRSIDPDGTFGIFDGNRTKYYWRSDFQFAKDHKFLAGVERESESAQTSSTFGGINAKNGNTGAYVELQSAFGDRFFVVSNIRHDDNDSFGGHNTWRIAPAFLIRETETRLKASYGTGFHAPTLDQRFNPFIGNPDLLPEESRGFDYGFEQSLWQKRLLFGVTWFRNDVENLIDFDPVTFANLNIQRAKTHGYEAFVAAQITNSLQVRADHTHVGIVSDGPVQVRRRPREKTSVSVVWQPTEKLTLSATALWVSGWIDVPRFGFTTVNAPGYNTVNLAADYRVSPNVTVFGRIDNVLDKHFQSPLGFEHTGIGFFAGIRATN
ncbi:MAG: TonB-dependent receptor [Xanthobacteraceae bacterium]